MESYVRALDRKKEADASLKNICKLIKSEGTSLDSIKDEIRLRTPEGEAEMRGEIERKLKIARWHGASLGTQFRLFEETENRDDVIRAEGKRAGLKGESAKPPGHFAAPQQQIWLEGHAEGQQVNLDRFQQQKDADAREFDQTQAPAQSDGSLAEQPTQGEA